MHPFGGTPICPRCSKAVYAAEQIMGPGRKLYHKPCLACMNCGKRLDSFSLVEHNEEPYCKNCHVKLFGTRDLRHANLPHRDELIGSPPASPVRPNTLGSNRAASPPPIGSRANSTGNGPGNVPPLPVRQHVTGVAGLDRTTSPPPTLLKPTRTLSPGRDHQRSRPTSLAQVTEQMQALRDLVEDQPEPEREKQDIRDGKEEVMVEEEEKKDWQPPATPTHVGRSAGGLPRTIPLTSNAGASAAPSQPSTPTPVARQTPHASDTERGRRVVPLPLAPTATGTRYGAALGGSISVPLSPTMTGRVGVGAGRGGSSPWGASGGTPRCGRCAQPVYFAEQVKAVGKTWHKGCLRCAECGHTLDSGRLSEKDGEPFCQRCYAKRFGPQGSGYALLGKPGG